MPWYAHSKNAAGQRQELTAHLRAVADLAAGFAADLGAAELGRYLGLWHDIGKFHPDWQRYLLESEANPGSRHRGPDHKAAGSMVVCEQTDLGSLLVQGHHGGLRSPSEHRRWLRERDRATDQPRENVGRVAIGIARGAMPEAFDVGELPLPDGAGSSELSAELFFRLLFSALVDADFLDTESHLNPDHTETRGDGYDLAPLWEQFRQYHARKTAGAAATTVNAARRDIYAACLAAAELPTGLFRLTVPTGGGKTLSGLAFALRHALKHDQRRIVVAVPYLSITEQTAAEYRAIFEPDRESGGDGAATVLEHHSGADAARRGDPGGDEYDSAATWPRLAAENWDAPIIVTTTVQLFESLFANTPSRCRKLHNLARSVIILDEAQTLPPRLLKSILDVLRELCARYGATVVISTATQPAFESIAELSDVREIVPSPQRYFRELSRVEYDWRLEKPMTWGEVADEMRRSPQALAVVNTRKDALSLRDELGDENALHLSTLLCGAHRRNAIATVKSRLLAGEPVRLVATQVVEAGVDVDFPLVLRALGPLDSIIQAAGRCNREGKLERGRVVVFRAAEGGVPRGVYRTATDQAESFISRYSPLGPDLDDPAIVGDYFRSLFALVDADPAGIQRLRTAFEYVEVGRKFEMIEDDSVSVVVDYGTDAERQVVKNVIDRLIRRDGKPRELLRIVQPYTVALRRHVADEQKRLGRIQEIETMPGLGIWNAGYHPVRGWTPADRTAAENVV